MKKTVTRGVDLPQEMLSESDATWQRAANGIGLTELLRMGSRKILEEAVKAEIDEYLQRGRYERVAAGHEQRGFRNGYRLTTIDTNVGPITYNRQRLADAPDFASAYYRPHMRRSEEFAESVTDMYVHGVSTRNIKKALRAVGGRKMKISRSTVSRITVRMREEFAAWQKRDLSDLKVAYLFLDAIRVGMRMGERGKDCVFIAYAALEDGSFETLSIGLGNSESDKSWGMFVGDLKKRGLKDPLLAISDGNSAVCSAIDAHFPESWRQRCVKHKMENILAQIPKDKHDEVRGLLNRIFYGATSLEQAKEALRIFKRDYGKVYASAVSRLQDELDQSLAFYMFPARHWRRIRTSNRLERMNKEIRRRLRKIGRHPDENGCLSLIYRLCTEYQQNKRAFVADDLVHAMWKKLREQKREMITQFELDLLAA